MNPLGMYVEDAERFDGGLTMTDACADKHQAGLALAGPGGTSGHPRPELNYVVT